MSEKLAICAIFKNESPFMREWITYHMLLGVDHFFLYDNESEDRGGSELGTLKDRVTITKWHLRPGQEKAYQHFVDQRHSQFEWVAFIDLDEFLYPVDGNSLPESLARYHEYSLVLLNWQMFGPNGDSGVHETRPSGLVIENYTRRLPWNREPAGEEGPFGGGGIHWYPKCIARLRDITGFEGAPHSLKTSGMTCNALLQPPITQGTRRGYPPACSEVLYINHYYTRSREDWNNKLASRAGIARSGWHPPDSRFEEFVNDANIEDRSITRFAPAVQELLGASDKKVIASDHSFHAVQTMMQSDSEQLETMDETAILRLRLEGLQQEWDREFGKKVAAIERLEEECAALKTELTQTVFERDAAAAEATKWSEAALAITADHSPLMIRHHGGRHRWWGNIIRRLIGNRHKRPSPVILADRSYAAGRWELAARYYRDALDLEPTEPTIWFKCGHALQAAGRTSAAEVAWSKAFEHSCALPSLKNAQLGTPPINAASGVYAKTTRAVNDVYHPTES